MNERSLRVLEYPKIVQMLKALTAFAPGAELADGLKPRSDLASVREELAETAEAVALLRDNGSHPVAGAKDVRIALGRAVRGGMLSGPDLLDVADTAAAAARCRRSLLEGTSPSPWPRLAALFEGVPDFRSLERAVRRCIGEDGVVLDRASDKLGRLRSQIRTWQARGRERLDAIVRSAASRQILQEALVTVRNDRYVIPVKVEHKASVPGIVHDTSSSGATVFIEPMAVVELNNKVKEAQAEEEREIERILRELSEQVGEHGVGLQGAVDALARLDFALAKARLARRMEAVRPDMNEEGWLNLQRARHPLLTGDVVPVDVWLGKGVRILVITGPNTGGKTVTLKTVGLFCLMAQSGLFVPADGAELPVYSGIFADIGDEQSIEQSLSTFSGHMANIVTILQKVDRDSLVLLDELGAGTDPAEGAALAMAILQHLAAGGVSGVATTHYSELKSFVHERPDMQNASVEFDPETLSPTYRLIMGTPGRSNALEIASRLGLPKSILAAAREQFAREGDVRTEDLLRDLERARREARDERQAATRLRQEAEDLRRRLEQARTELRAKRDEWERQARSEARQVLSDARREVETIIADLRRRGDEFGVEQARTAHRRIEHRLDDAAPKEHPDPVADGAETRDEAFTPAVGDEVEVLTLRRSGTIRSGPDGEGQWTVQVGGMRIVVAPEALAPARTPAEDRSGGRTGRRVDRSGTSQRSAPTLSPAKRAAIATEISLRGMPVDEALHALEKYLDDALLAGLDRVLVVHGKGTGALRRAVHDYVKHHPHVTRFHIAEPSQGGYGATVVEL